MHLEAFRRFIFDKGINRIKMIKRGLQGSIVDVMAALDIIPYMEIPDRLECFPDLIRLSFSQRHNNIVKQIISTLPREWVVERIEETAEPLIRRADSIDYRQLLDLFRTLDSSLAMRLAQRAATQLDVDIAEAGDDYIKLLSTPNDNTRLRIK